MDRSDLCPRCGAEQDRSEADRLTRCSSCGTLLSSGEWPAEAMVARPRLDPPEARSLVARRLARYGRLWLPGSPQLVFYPLAVTGELQTPLAPLAPLPPVVREQWRPSGADLQRLDSRAGSNSLDAFGAMRVPISFPAPTMQRIVHYPLYRVPLVRDAEESAAWCDGCDGQVLLPPSLQRPLQAVKRIDLSRWTIGGAISGLGSGLLLPFGWAAGLSVLIGATLWRKTTRS